MTSLWHIMINWDEDSQPWEPEDDFINDEELEEAGWSNEDDLKELGMEIIIPKINNIKEKIDA